MTLRTEIDSIPAIDQHAHNIRKPESALPFEAAFTEASDPLSWQRDVPHGLFYRRSIRQLAELLGCPADPESVKRARGEHSLEQLTALYLKAANLRALILDDGLSPQDILPWQWHEQFVPIKRVLRIEQLVEQLLPSHKTFSTFESAFRERLQKLCPSVVGFKSIAAYRGGLRVGLGKRSDAKLDYSPQIRRIGRSDLYSYLIRTACEIAQSLNMPFQFHTGFGDPDLALEDSNPLWLRPLIERYSCPFVLLHAGYPFVRESGYLASVYPNAWVDFGLALPFLSYQGMKQSVSALLELTPLNKILYSSDASLIPDLYALGSVNSRAVLNEVLCETVRDGDLNHSEALQAAHWILAENALRLYRFKAS